MRKNKVRSVCVLLLAVAFALSLAACAQTSAPTGAPTSAAATSTPESQATQQPTEAQATATPEPTPEPLYSIQVLNTTYTDGSITKSDQTAIGKVILDKFNIEFTFINYVGNVVEKQNLMLATGDYPEIITLQGEDVFQNYLKAGDVVCLDPYLNDMPNFKELYKNQIPYWRLSDPNGGLYKYERLVPNDPTIWTGYYDVMVRSDVLEKQGFPKVLSTSSYVELLKQGLKDFPTTNGKKSIGMSVEFAEDYGLTGIGEILLEKGSRYINLNNVILFDTQTKKYVPAAETDPVKDTYHFFNVLFREGLLDPECFTDTGALVTEKCNAARPLSTWYSRWNTDAANATFYKNNQEGYVYVMTPVQSDAQAAAGEKRLIPSVPNRPFESVVITKNAKYPERLIKLIEWCCSEDGQRLLQTGVEGQQYTLEGGKVTITQDYLDNNADQSYVSKIGYGVGDVLPWATIRDSNGTPFSINNIPDDRKPVDTRAQLVYSHWGNYKNINDYWSANGQSYDVGLILTVSVGKNNADLDTLVQKIKDYEKKNLAATIVNPKNDEEFETAWANYMKGYEALGPQALIEECDKQYAESIGRLQEMQNK